ncbi:MAG: amino acid ABC transporter permease [Deltaproteobacteria bacterium]|jgi:polar amino acid transport system permease protein|nr:amino acid ABC transporter permease [Deltaproteobacteria bacterium]
MDLVEYLKAALYILQGTGYTAALILGAMSLGFAIGLPIASLEIYGPRWIARILSLYVWFFRGIPILVLLFLVYFGIYSAIERIAMAHFGLRLELSPFSASLVALGLASGAYQSQIFRGAILSLPRGQFLAATALGFTARQAVFRVVIPQALRISIPAWSNEYSILLKDSAVAYMLGTLEIMARTKFMAAYTYKHIPFYVFAGLLYFTLTWLGVKGLKALERRTRIPGLGHEF